MKSKKMGSAVVIIALVLVAFSFSLALASDDDTDTSSRSTWQSVKDWWHRPMFSPGTLSGMIYTRPCYTNNAPTNTNNYNNNYANAASRPSTIGSSISAWWNRPMFSQGTISGFLYNRNTGTVGGGYLYDPNGGSLINNRVTQNLALRPGTAMREWYNRPMFTSGTISGAIYNKNTHTVGGGYVYDPKGGSLINNTLTRNVTFRPNTWTRDFVSGTKSVEVTKPQDYPSVGRRIAAAIGTVVNPLTIGATAEWLDLSPEQARAYKQVHGEVPYVYRPTGTDEFGFTVSKNILGITRQEPSTMKLNDAQYKAIESWRDGKTTMHVDGETMRATFEPVQNAPTVDRKISEAVLIKQEPVANEPGFFSRTGSSIKAWWDRPMFSPGTLSGMIYTREQYRSPSPIPQKNNMDTRNIYLTQNIQLLKESEFTPVDHSTGLWGSIKEWWKKPWFSPGTISGLIYTNYNRAQEWKQANPGKELSYFYRPYFTKGTLTGLIYNRDNNKVNISSLPPTPQKNIDTRNLQFLGYYDKTITKIKPSSPEDSNGLWGSIKEWWKKPWFSPGTISGLIYTNYNRAQEWKLANPGKELSYFYRPYFTKGTLTGLLYNRDNNKVEFRPAPANEVKNMSFSNLTYIKSEIHLNEDATAFGHSTDLVTKIKEWWKRPFFSSGTLTGLIYNKDKNTVGAGLVYDPQGGSLINNAVTRNLTFRPDSWTRTNLIDIPIRAGKEDVQEEAKAQGWQKVKDELKHTRFKGDENFPNTPEMVVEEIIAAMELGKEYELDFYSQKEFDRVAKALKEVERTHPTMQVDTDPWHGSRTERVAEYIDGPKEIVIRRDPWKMLQRTIAKENAKEEARANGTLVPDYDSAEKAFDDFSHRAPEMRRRIQGVAEGKRDEASFELFSSSIDATKKALDALKADGAPLDYKVVPGKGLLSPDKIVITRTPEQAKPAAPAAEAKPKAAAEEKSPPVTQANKGTYEVQEGDGLFQIWKRDYSSKQSWENFAKGTIELNNIKDADHLEVGQKLEIPSPDFINKAELANPAEKFDNLIAERNKLITDVTKYREQTGQLIAAKKEISELDKQVQEGQAKFLKTAKNFTADPNNKTLQNEFDQNKALRNSSESKLQQAKAKFDNITAERNKLITDTNKFNELTTKLETTAQETRAKNEAPVTVPASVVPKDALDYTDFSRPSPEPVKALDVKAPDVKTLTAQRDTLREKGMALVKPGTQPSDSDIRQIKNYRKQIDQLNVQIKGLEAAPAVNAAPVPKDALDYTDFSRPSPDPVKADTKQNTYEVKEGDGLYKIWKSDYSNTHSWENFANGTIELNNIQDADRINAWEKLIIPPADLVKKVEVAVSAPTNAVPMESIKKLEAPAPTNAVPIKVIGSNAVPVAIDTNVISAKIGITNAAPAKIEVSNKSEPKAADVTSLTAKRDALRKEGLSLLDSGKQLTPNDNSKIRDLNRQIWTLDKQINEAKGPTPPVQKAPQGPSSAAAPVKAETPKSAATNDLAALPESYHPVVKKLNNSLAEKGYQPLTGKEMATLRDLSIAYEGKSDPEILNDISNYVSRVQSSGTNGIENIVNDYNEQITGSGIKINKAEPVNVKSNAMPTKVDTKVKNDISIMLADGSMQSDTNKVSLNEVIKPATTNKTGSEMGHFRANQDGTWTKMKIEPGKGVELGRYVLNPDRKTFSKVEPVKLDLPPGEFKSEYSRFDENGNSVDFIRTTTEGTFRKDSASDSWRKVETPAVVPLGKDEVETRRIENNKVVETTRSGPNGVFRLNTNDNSWVKIAEPNKGIEPGRYVVNPDGKTFTKVVVETNKTDAGLGRFKFNQDGTSTKVEPSKGADLGRFTVNPDGKTFTKVSEPSSVPIIPDNMDLMSKMGYSRNSQIVGTNAYTSIEGKKYQIPTSRFGDFGLYKNDNGNISKAGGVSMGGPVNITTNQKINLSDIMGNK